MVVFRRLVARSNSMGIKEAEALLATAAMANSREDSKADNERIYYLLE